MKETYTGVFQPLWQVLFLMAIAGLIGLAANHWREAPLPLIGDWSATAPQTDGDGSNLTISLEEAKQLFEGKAARFLDARPQSQYEEGHMRGALSLPWQDATNVFTEIAGQLQDSDTLITYCDGESCELSHDLAIFLKDMGFTDVRVLVNGWTVWQDAGLPVATGGPANEL